MQIFKFDPSTGERGEKIQDAGLVSWTSYSVDWAVDQGILKEIPCTLPSTGWKLHVDAGRDLESYLCDQWVCFCIGKFWPKGTDEEGSWSWVVLPPKNLLEAAKLTSE